MGLAEAIQQAVASGFTALDNLRKSCNYHSTGIVKYDSSSGSYTETGGTDQPNLLVVFSSYSSEEIDGETIQKEDKKGLIPSLSLTINPKLADYLIEDEAGIRWDVKNFKVDPATALWTLQLRMHEKVS